MQHDKPLALVLLLLALSSCGDGAKTGAGGSGGAGGAGGAQPPEASCVRPGDVGNNRGVGTYCTPTGNECDPFVYAPLCLAAVGQDQWFCTRIGCDPTTDCGMGAGCEITSEGSACVPCRCEPSALGCAGAGGAGSGG